MALNRELLTQIEEALERALLNTFTGAYRPGRMGTTGAASRQRLEEQREQSKQNIQRQKDARLAKNITEAQKNLLESYRKATSILEDEAKDSERRQEAQEEYQDALEESVEVLKKYTGKYRELIGRSLYNQLGEFKELSKNTHGLTSALAASQRNTSLLAAAMIESYNEVEFGTDKYRAYMRQLNSAVSKLDTAFLQQSDMIDEQTGSLRDSLSPEDFANLRKSLGEAQTVISENLGRIGIKNLAEFLSSEAGKKIFTLPTTGKVEDNPPQDFRDAMLLLARQLEKMGYSIGQGLEEAESVDWEKLAAKISEISDSTDQVTKNLNKVAKNANIVAGEFLSTGYLFANLRNKFIKPLIETGSILAAAAKSKDAVIDVYRQITEFNIASIPASFLDVQIASARLGMSFDETVDFLKENKRTLAIYGPQAGYDLIDSLRPVFNSFGYSLKQASEIVGPAIEAGIATGINIKSGQQLNSFIEDSMNAFKNISSIVNISAKEYMALNAELLGSSDIQGMLLGMDRDRAVAYSKQLIALRDNYVQLGLSTQQAQELVRTQEAQKREEATTRVREGAKGMVLAKQLGLSDEAAQRYFQLSMLGMARTKEQDKEFTEISRQMGLAKEQQLRMASDLGLGSQIIQEVMQTALTPGGVAGELMKQGQPLSTAERANIQLSEKTAALARSLGMGSESLAVFNTFVDSVSSILKNSLTIGAGAATFSLLALTFQARAASKALGLIAGNEKGMLSTVYDKIFGKKGGPAGKAPTGKGGTLGKIAGIGGKVGGVAAVMGTTALLSSLDISEKIESLTGSKGLGAFTSILSSAAMGAGGGFMTGGPWGALLGGLFGIGTGVYNNWDSILSAARGTPSIEAPQIIQQAIAETENINRDARASGIINVVDTGANEKLKVISENVSKIVSIMQAYDQAKPLKPASSSIDSSPAPFSIDNMNQLPSGLSFVTGA